MDKTQIRSNILSFLRSHGVMTLATVSGDKPWVCTVYYAVDDDMNLIILTDPGSRHGKEIAANPKVAFSIYDSQQPNSAPVKIGIQGTGTIAPVKGLADNTRALLAWHKANPGKEKDISIDDVIKVVTDARMYRVTPRYLKHFDKSLYPGGKYGFLTLE